MNVEFQRLTRRDRKAFLSDQWKEIEENTCEDGDSKGQKLYEPNRSRRYLGRGGKTPKKSYTEKDLNDPVNHDGVITHLDPDILE